jgi:hypothetical protein
MNLTIKNLKTLAPASGGIPFSCTLYRDGKRIAYVSDEGRGGQIRIDFVDSKGKAIPRREADPIEKELIQYALEAKGEPSTCDTCDSTGYGEPKPGAVEGSLVASSCPDCNLAFSGRCTLDILIEDLVNAYEEKRWLKRQCRQKVLFQVPGDKAGEWRIIADRYTPAIAKQIRAQHGDSVRIGNEEI